MTNEEKVATHCWPCNVNSFQQSHLKNDCSYFNEKVKNLNRCTNKCSKNRLSHKSSNPYCDTSANLSLSKNINDKKSTRHTVRLGNNMSLLHVVLIVVQLFLIEIKSSNAAIFNRKLGGVSLDCGGVFLTVSSLWKSSSTLRSLKDAELELNWDLACDSSSTWAIPDWVGLFTTDPTAGFNVAPIVRVDVKDHPNGYYKTNVSFSRSDFPAGWNQENDPNRSRSEDSAEESNASTLVPYTTTQQPIISGPHCLPYWIASFNNNTLIKANCLKIQPTWMYDYKTQIGWVPIGSLFIPGTHNSGCYYRNQSLSRRNLFQRYVMTQDRDIWSQLVYGIRYFDMRVGYYATTSIFSNPNQNESHKFWINHDLVSVRPLLPILREVRRFMDLSKGEIVVLDFHRFPVGFTKHPERHSQLLALIEKELGHLILPPFNVDNGFGPTLNEIWNTDKRLIIAYNDNEIAQDTPWVWSPLKQYWGDEQTPIGLKNYIQKVISDTQPKNEKNPLWAIMAELTPSPLVFLNLEDGSLRRLADMVNRNITTWFRTKWWRQANIVATDFFLGNNIIDVAINSNIYKIKLI